MNATCDRSGTTWMMSPVSNAPAPSARWRIVPPGKWPPPRTSVSPSPRSSVSPSQGSIASSRRMIPSALDLGGGRVVEQRDAFPQEVRVAPRDEQRALADGELRLGADADELALGPDRVLVVRCELRERRPPLAVRWHVLAR